MTGSQTLAPSREADFIKACRYQSKVSPRMLNHCKSRAVDNSQDPQVRIQSLLLIARTKLCADIIKEAKEIFNEDNILIKRAASLILVRQRGKKIELSSKL